MNYMSPKESSGGLVSSVFALLDRVEYRRIELASDFDDVEKLRKLSYEHRPFIDTSIFGPYLDKYDHEPDCYVIGVYIDEKLVSTVRLHVVSMDHLHGPSYTYFSDEIKTLLQSGARAIDPSRFASDPHMLWTYPMIPLLTLRAAAMAAEYFETDYCTNFVREDVAAFYKRSFGAVEIGAAKPCHTFTVPILLLNSAIRDIREKIATRYPFFQSEPYERKMMFAPREEQAYPSLNILPTAKYTHRRNLAQAAANFPSPTPA